VKGVTVGRRAKLAEARASVIPSQTRPLLSVGWIGVNNILKLSKMPEDFKQNVIMSERG
jgi:hypothetical protein